MLFHRHRILLIDLQNMSASGKSKPYRQKVKCSVCKKLVDSDYKEKHASSQHKKEKVVFSVVVSKNQTKIAFQGDTSSSKLYTTSTCTSVSGEVVSSSKSVCTSGRSTPFSQVSGGDDANLDDGVSATAVDTVIHEPVYSYPSKAGICCTFVANVLHTCCTHATLSAIENT